MFFFEKTRNFQETALFNVVPELAVKIIDKSCIEIFYQLSFKRPFLSRCSILSFLWYRFLWYSPISTIFSQSMLHQLWIWLPKSEIRQKFFLRCLTGFNFFRFWILKLIFSQYLLDLTQKRKTHFHNRICRGTQRKKKKIEFAAQSGKIRLLSFLIFQKSKKLIFFKFFQWIPISQTTIMIRSNMFFTNAESFNKMYSSVFSQIQIEVDNFWEILSF